MALVRAKRERHPTHADRQRRATQASSGDSSTDGSERGESPTPANGELPIHLQRAHALDALTSTALTQLDLAIELLQERSGEPAPQTVHETRKALKRLRALMRLLRVHLGSRRFTRENVTLRDAGRALAGARDAQVMVSTLEQILERHPKRLARSAAIARLRAQLVAEREHAAALADAEHDSRELVLAALRAQRARIADWTFQESDRQAVELGLKRIYREGRERRATAEQELTTQSLHNWRKRVKDLRHAAEMLDRPGHPARRLRTVARRADRLGELLGLEHDLALLAARVQQEKACFDGERATHRDLLRLIARRRRRMRRRALRLGQRLYQRRARAFTRRTYPAPP